jgi:hypothetical protein
MKKLIFYFLSFICLFSILSCNKLGSLNGTTWYDLSSDVSKRYVFISNSECIAYSDNILNDGQGEHMVNYTYQYSYPEVKLYFVSTNIYLLGRMLEFADLKGVINGDEMVLTNLSTHENIGTVKKIK